MSEPSTSRSAQEQTTEWPSPSAVPVAPANAERVGRFAVLRPVAKGGLGEVLLAHDEELSRDVALKRIQERHLGNPESQRRFLQEAAVTAQLEHPGVVPMYGLVRDVGGQPCYAMRFIQGQSLAEAIKTLHENGKQELDRLVFRQLLQRFITVCQTIGYAHSRGIIHRDLKPANVMLGPFGETLVVDWGLAKASNRSESEVRGEGTATSSLTPNQSPAETIAGQPLGTPQYMSPEQACGNWDKVGPATDIYSLGATLYVLLTGQGPFVGRTAAEVLQQVQIGAFHPPRRIKPTVPKALEAICLKAMARRQENRYASAQHLASDLEHWLADESVTAYQDSWLTQAGRWIRRHRTLATGSAVAFIAAAALLIVVVVLLQTQKVVLAQALERETEAHRRADSARARTRQALDDMTSQVGETWLSELPRLDSKQKAFLQTAVSYYQEFAGERSDSPAERKQLAAAYYRLGNLQVHLGENLAAESALRRARDLEAQLAAETPSDLEAREHLAQADSNLGATLVNLGRLAEAETAMREAVKTQSQITAQAPDEPRFRRELAACQTNLANVLMDAGQGKEAEPSFRTAVDLLTALVDASPSDVELRWQLARTQSSFASLLASLGRTAEAENAFRQAVTIREKVVAEGWTTQSYLRGLALAHTNFGVFLRMISRLPDAADEQHKSIALLTPLSGYYSAVPEYRRDLTFAHDNLGIVLMEQGRLADAEHEHGVALTLATRLATNFPDSTTARQDISRIQNNLALVLIRLNRRPEAKTLYRQTLATREKLMTDFPAIPTYRVDWAIACANFASLLMEMDEDREALVWFAKGIPALEDALGRDRRVVLVRQALRNACVSQALAYNSLERYAEAARSYDRAVELGPDPLPAKYRRDRALTLAHAGEHSQAVAEAEILTTDRQMPPDGYYTLACVYALAAGAVKNEGNQSDKLAARAVELLRQAIARGHRETEQLKTDEDLKSLHGREDFKKLLEATKQQKREEQ